MTYDDYVNLLIDTVRQNRRPGEAAVTAANVGMFLRAAAPEVSYRTFGKRNLLAVLEELEQAGKLKLVRTAKDALAVELAPATDSAPLTRVTAPVARSTFNPLHVSVWNAFVLGAPAGRRFLHRTTGAIRSGLDSAPSPADEWVEIMPVPFETQHEWATQFVAEHASQHADDLREALDAQPWHPRAFLPALKAINDGLARRWNLCRSQQVSRHVQKWLDSHAISHHLAFNSEARSPVSLDAAVEGDDAGRESTRRAILSALASLPLEQLLDLRIPAGALVAALQATRR